MTEAVSTLRIPRPEEVFRKIDRAFERRGSKTTNVSDVGSLSRDLPNIRKKSFKSIVRREINVLRAVNMVPEKDTKRTRRISRLSGDRLPSIGNAVDAFSDACTGKRQGSNLKNRLRRKESTMLLYQPVGRFKNTGEVSTQLIMMLKIHNTM